MDLIYSDDRIVVCVKPSGILSTDEPGGMPSLIRIALGDPNATVKTVHRLDQAVSGIMVFARTARAASDLSAQIRNGTFQKHYLAVVHGQPPQRGTLQDLLIRDKMRRLTAVASEPDPAAQEATLEYETVGTLNSMSMVSIRLITGRTHQIRVQFSSRSHPLWGDKKYGIGDDAENIALWSYKLQFHHPRTGELMTFTKQPPAVYPWTRF